MSVLNILVEICLHQTYYTISSPTYHTPSPLRGPQPRSGPCPPFPTSKPLWPLQTWPAKVLREPTLIYNSCTYILLISIYNKFDSYIIL